MHVLDEARDDALLVQGLPEQGVPKAGVARGVGGEPRAQVVQAGREAEGHDAAERRRQARVLHEREHGRDQRVEGGELVRAHEVEVGVEEVVQAPALGRERHARRETRHVDGEEVEVVADDAEGVGGLVAERERVGGRREERRRDKRA